MVIIFEVTTIAGKMQRYEVIEVTPYRLANNGVGVSIRNINDSSLSDHLAGHAYHAYSMTGLDDSIKQYPPNLLIEHDGERFTHAEIMAPERLRLIYDTFPQADSHPVLRICPTEGQIYVAEYDFEKAKLPLERMTFSQEFDGSLDLQFTGLHMLLHLRDFEKENRDYYGRDLKQDILSR